METNTLHQLALRLKELQNRFLVDGEQLYKSGLIDAQPIVEDANADIIRMLEIVSEKRSDEGSK